MITAYAGIGSRTISHDERALIIKISNFLSEKGYVCYDKPEQKAHGFSRGMNANTVMILR